MGILKLKSNYCNSTFLPTSLIIVFFPSFLPLSSLLSSVRFNLQSIWKTKKWSNRIIRRHRRPRRSLPRRTRRWARPRATPAPTIAGSWSNKDWTRCQDSDAWSRLPPCPRAAATLAWKISHVKMFLQSFLLSPLPPKNKHSSIHSISSCFYERGLGVDCLILSFTFLRNALDTLGISLVMQWQRKFRMGFIILLYLYHFSQCTHNALKVRPNQFFTTMHGSFVSLESNIFWR